VICRGRYQLDFRHQHARTHADAVVDRLVRDYGVGYIKMDYNIDHGIGTDVAADSPGAGALEHVRAYYAWLDAVLDRYPELIVENCSSGGLRMDYGMLARCSIQSTSDQEDYRRYGVIAPALASGAAPEQQAVWSYPLRDGDLEETRFNMVNALLGRIHQSGHLAELAPERLAAVQEGIAVYRSIRATIRQAMPCWPLGLPRLGDDWACAGLQHADRLLLAVWRLGAEDAHCAVDLPGWAGARVGTLYPASDPAPFWRDGRLALHLDAAPWCARLYDIRR
ncbi:MAG: glycoside hydrolase family 36 protein, partial [Planctomycetota bacterium]